MVVKVNIGTINSVKSDKLSRSYVKLYYGITFLGHKVYK